MGRPAEESPYRCLINILFFIIYCEILGSVREICGVAHVVSLAQRILGVMAHVR